MTDDLIELPCITLHRPWAAWVAAGLKPIETRTHDKFKGLQGKWIGIHCGQHFALNAYALAIPWARRLGKTLMEILTAGKAHDEPGRILCVAKVTNARWLTAKDSRRALIDCGGTKRFGLELWGVTPLPKAPATLVKGRQGIFRVKLPKELLMTAGWKADVEALKELRAESPLAAALPAMKALNDFEQAMFDAQLTAAIKDE